MKICFYFFSSAFFFLSCESQLPIDYQTSVLAQNILENKIHNKTNNPYYETVAKICLEELNLVGVVLIIEPIDEDTKKQFEKNGETIDAHLRDFSDYYVLYVNEDSNKNLERIISHELVHLSQYNTGRLAYENEKIIWLGDKFGVEEILYPERPWEIEAFESEVVLAKKIKNRLD